jgi:hypothetical protein
MRGADVNDPTPVRKAVLVIGMHRSGTSALTRGLEVLGVDLGTRLKSPRTENPKGFWEDLDFNSINTEVLRSFGLEWHTLGRIDAALLRSAQLTPMLDRAVAFLDKKFQASTTIGLKDPKASRILPFWEHAFEQAGISPSYIIACRNPMSVAQSLSSRDGFPTIQGHFLWLDYMLCSLEQSSIAPRILVSYDNLLENPGRELARISSALSLAFDMQSENFLEYNTKFLSHSLRSTNFTTQDLLASNTAPSIIKDAYSLLNDLSYDRRYPSDHSVREEISRMNELFTKDLFFYFNSIEKIKKLERLEKEIHELKNKNSILQKEIDKICKGNKLKYLLFKFKEKKTYFLNHNNINNILLKSKRLFKSALLILANTKSWSSLRSLPHEFGEILKRTKTRRTSEKRKKR